MRIHFVIHESFESPAAIEIWAKEKNYTLTYSKVYNMEALPADAKGFDFLVVMGGPQSPTTTLVECPHFNAQAEMNLIKQAIVADKLVLGVCLGAQLIGAVLGAPCERSPNKEIGVYPLTLTSAAVEDPIFTSFPQTFPAGHWHGDMPGLTKDAVVLAYSEGCPRQVIWYASKVYAFQCHFEFTPDAIEGMIKHCEHELSVSDLPYIQTAAQLRNNDYQEANEMLFKFLNSFCML